MSGVRTVLVTGAAGGIGVEVAARLARSGYAVIGMVHRTTGLVRNNGRRLRSAPLGAADEPGGVATLPADIAAPGLGLSPELRTDLARRTDLIVHCAAVTAFGREPELYEAVNVRGTDNVIAFAVAAAVPIVHVSTAYVCGERAGLVQETDLDRGQRFANHYEESKFRAELAVRAAGAAGLPVAVVRPSIVVGAAHGGTIRDFTNMYVVLRVLTRGLVRTIPGDYDAALDLVPIDHVADAVARVVYTFDSAAGLTFHVVASAPLTLRDFSDVLAEFPSMRVPRFVPPYGFDPRRLPERERRYYDKIVRHYESYFRRHVTFGAASAHDLMGGPPRAGGRPFLRRLLRYGMRVGYFAPPPHHEAGLAREVASA